MSYKNLLVFFILSTTCFAANLFVVNGGDAGRGTLREAIEDANDGDTIFFQVATVVLTTVPIQIEDDNLTFAPDINAGLQEVTINGSNVTGIFDDDNGNTLTFNNIRFVNAFSETSGGALTTDNGDITFVACDFINCRAAISGGAIAIDGGSLNLTNCNFQNCQAELCGGAIAGDSNETVDMDNCTFVGNRVNGNFAEAKNSIGRGGAFSFDANATLTIDNCTFTNNTASDHGGAVHLENNTSADFSDCVFTGNRATNSSGGAVANGADNGIAFIRCEFKNNVANLKGGGINNASVDEDTDGIVVNGDIDEITDCLFFQNTALKDVGGGLCNTRENDEDGETSVITLIQRSVFFGNRSNFEGGGIANEQGAEITDMDNCTISTNVAGVSGGGIFDEGDPNGVTGGTTIDIDSCTITLNNAPEGSGITTDDADSNVGLQNTIVAQNAGNRDIINDGFTDNGNNLIGNGDDSAVFVNGNNGNIVGTAAVPENAALLAIADNGGERFTHALAANSQAIDAGNTDLAEDGRGFARPVNIDDIGAFEFGAVVTLSPEVLARVKQMKIKLGKTKEGVVVRWSGSDAKLFGYNIMRKWKFDTSKAGFQKMNEQPIAVKRDKPNLEYEFLDTNCEENEHYIYKIECLAQEGENFYSKERKVKYHAPKGKKPKNRAIVTVTDAGVEITGQMRTDNNIIGAHIDRKVHRISGWVTLTEGNMLTGDKVEFTDIAPVANTRMYYRIRYITPEDGVTLNTPPTKIFIEK